MRKFSPNHRDDTPPRRRSRTPAAITIPLGLLLSPLVYEASLLCAANWRSVLGPETLVDTPVLNTVVAGMQSAGEDIRSTLAPVLHHLPWTPSYVVVFGLGWASIAALMLRR